uniref:C2H2-type domain-containing protein n=1 Tax=Panagrolaimus sp. PS1159 TaxID=55785 RepID=A0AC35FTV4_9BILA
MKKGVENNNCSSANLTESLREHCQTSGHLTRTNFMQNNTSIGGLGFQIDETESAMDLSMETRNGEESNYQCLKCDFHTSEEESAIDHLQDHEITTSAFETNENNRNRKKSKHLF